MPGIGLLTALLEFFGKWFKPKEPYEPVLDGYEGLTKGNASLIRSLGKRIEHLERDNEKLHKKTEDCTKEREELQERVETLERNAEVEKQYAHSHAHLFENYMKTLEKDLEAHGILPDAREAIIKIQREREEERNKEQRRLLGLPE